MAVGSDIPFVPTSDDRLKKMIELAQVKPGEKAVDLGCGDGRVIIALAKAGAEAYGYEIDKNRAEIAIKKVLEEGLSKNVHVFCQNFWDVDLRPFDIVAIYGITSIMNRLEIKLKKELKPGSRVVSNYFPFPTWEPEKKEGSVYLYRYK